MIVDPNEPFLAGVRGRVGQVVFQSLRSRHIARRRWTIRARATDAQALHRLAFGRAASLYQSVRLDVRPAWLPYAQALRYGPYAAWQHLNTPALKQAVPTHLTPPNLDYVPITAANWARGQPGQIVATWSYSGPPATVYCSTYYRPADSYAWIYDALVDATDEARTVSGLEADAPYEVALLPHVLAKTTFGESYHQLLDAGGVYYEDFTTYTEVDPDEELEVEARWARAVGMRRDFDTYLYDDKGADFFGLTWLHDLECYWESCDSEAAGSLWGVSNSVEDSAHWWNTNQQALGLRFYRNPASCQLFFENHETHEQHKFEDYAVDTTYWLTVERTSDIHVEARVYTDAARTDLFHTHELTVGATRQYRYLFAINSWNDGSPQRITFRVRDLNLHEFG
ncbi:hypothetical protein ES705_29934 [subsurface metagenome]